MNYKVMNDWQRGITISLIQQPELQNLWCKYTESTTCQNLQAHRETSVSICDWLAGQRGECKG